MKALGKKVCVSVTLEELFEVVDDNDLEVRLGRDLKNGRRKQFRGMDGPHSMSQAKEVKGGRGHCPGKSRIPRGKYSSTQDHHLDPLYSVSGVRTCARTGKEKVHQGTMTDPEMENVYDVDEYSESYLSFLNYQVKRDDRSTQTINDKVSVGLATSFTSKSGMQVGVKAESCGSDGYDRGEKGKPPMSRYDLGMDYGSMISRGRCLLEDITPNKSSFMVARCAKSTNLTIRSHTSAQFAPAAALYSRTVSSDPGRYLHGENGSNRPKDRGINLTELFCRPNSRKSTSGLKRAEGSLQKLSASGACGKAARLILDNRAHSDSRISHHLDWRNRSCGCLKVSQSMATHKVVCDLLMKTFMEAHYKELLCYTLILPTGIEVYRDLHVNWVGFQDAENRPDPLAIVKNRPGDDWAVNALWLGTQCNQIRSGTFSTSAASFSSTLTQVLVMESEPEEADTGEAEKTNEEDEVEETMEEEYGEMDGPEEDDALEEVDSGECEEGEAAEAIEESVPQKERESAAIPIIPEMIEEEEEVTVEEQLAGLREGSNKELTDGKAILEALAPQILEQLNLIEITSETCELADKAVNTEHDLTGGLKRESVSFQWKIEVEVQNEDWKDKKQGAKEQHSDTFSTHIIEATEDVSSPSAVFLCQSPYDKQLVVTNPSQSSFVCNFEKASVVEKNIRDAYLNGLPRVLPNYPENCLRELDEN